MKKLITTLAVTTALLAPGLVLAEGDGGQDVMRELADIKAKLKTQQQVIEAMSEVAAGAGGGANIKIGNDSIDGFTFKGDLRLRYERRDRDNYGTAVDDARDRMRTRFRVGGVWKNKKESWEIGAGLATGGDDGRSTNDTWSDTNYFKTGDIRLDYAYAAHKLGDSFSVTVGQQINPLYSSWILWDSDLRPVGFTGQFKSNGVFVTAAAYDLWQNVDKTYGDDIGFVYALQAGYEGKAGGNMAYKLAGAYYSFDTKTFNANVPRPNPDYEYKIGALTGEFGGVAGPVKWKTRGEYWKNFGAEGAVGKGVMGGTLDPNQEDTGWTLGVEAMIKDFRLSYDYVVVGADSVNPYLKDSDFGDGIGVGVDVKGHRLGAGYSITKNCSLDLTAMLSEPNTMTAKEAKVEGLKLYQVDLNYKF